VREPVKKRWSIQPVRHFSWEARKNRKPRAMREYSLCMIVIAAFIASQLDSTSALRRLPHFGWVFSNDLLQIIIAIAECYSCTSTTNDTGNCLTSPSTQTSIECDNECYTLINAGGFVWLMTDYFIFLDGGSGPLIDQCNQRW